MNKKKIETQEDIDKLIEFVDWDHCFIREVYVQSPSYAKDNWEIAADALPSLMIFLSSAEDDCPGVEFFFEEVERLCLDFGCFYQGYGCFDKGKIKFAFWENPREFIVAKSLTVEILDKSCWGWKTRYGIHYWFDETGDKFDYER